MLDYGIRVGGELQVFDSLDDAVAFFGIPGSFTLDYPAPMFEGYSIEFEVSKWLPRSVDRILSIFTGKVEKDYGGRRISGIECLGRDYSFQELNTLFAYFASCIAVQDATLRFSSDFSIDYLKIGDLVLIENMSPPRNRLVIPQPLSVAKDQVA